MKIIDEKLKKNKGRLTLKIETLDDLWHLMNIIFPGDKVFSKTTRRIRISSRENGSSKDKGERRPVYVGIIVEKVALHKFSNVLRIKGKIVHSSNELIPLGEYHTIAIKIGSHITIEKEYWPNFILDRIEKATKKLDIPVTLFISIDEGESCFLLATTYEMIELTRISISIPGKRYAPKQHDEGLKRFLKDTLNTLLMKTKELKPSNIIIVGPGFVKTHFLKLIEEKKVQFASINISVLNSSVGCYTGIYEVIRSGALGKLIERVQVLRENNLFEELLAHIGGSDGLATYGLSNVETAANYGAIAKLLILDKLLREIETIEDRNRIESLLQKVEQYGGEILIINSEHNAGQQLLSLGGIAAILRYKLKL